MSEEIEVDDSEKDDMTILNEILNAPSASGEDDFSREWQAVFGHTSLAAGGVTLTPGETDQSQKSAEFMPSNLLDVDLQLSSMNINNGEFFKGKTIILYKELPLIISNTDNSNYSSRQTK